MVIRLRSRSAKMSSSCRVSPDAVRDDFLRSTMRIFLVVSPPACRIQGRSRSLTHIDQLDPAMLVKPEDMDSKSEPDTSQEQLIVPSSEALHRRRKLSRSQVSSSEFVSVSFECLDDPGPEEFLPATKGTTLAEALRNACERRGVDLNTIYVYLDSSKTPLPVLTTETYWLGGKHLRIRAKDGAGNKSPVSSTRTPQRKTSGSYRCKGSRFFSASTEDTSHAGDSPGSGSVSAGGISHGDGSLKATKSSKQSNRWSGLFSNSYKDTKMDSLVEQLNTYSKNGIPKLPHLLTFENEDESEQTLYSLEENWHSVVNNWAGFSERLRQQQTAIWELVDTEASYLRTLKVITDLFLACLCNLQGAGILNEVDTALLFSNIPEIYGANRAFWQHHMLPMLTRSRADGTPLDPLLLKEGFLKFREIFHPYAKYCAEQSSCQHYCKEKHHENEFFKAYLAWCETQRDCNRLRLVDILVKPMQRMTKYSLLLKAIHKNTEDMERRRALEEMIQCVESFVVSVNSTLRQRQEHERLREIIARIGGYDVVETRDDDVEKLVRQHSKLDLTCPMPNCIETQRRHLLFESDLKLKDNTTSKLDVRCFLFTDLFLVCKSVAKKGERVKVIRQPYVVDRLIVHELTKDSGGLALVYLNEYGSAAAAFTLHSSEIKLIKTWQDQIRKAQAFYREAKAAAVAAAAAANASMSGMSQSGEGMLNASLPYDLIDDDLDMPSSALLVARSPKGSSRGSHVSSLVHSHSGSVDMNEASSGSISQGRGVSLENDLRGSSVSSDEGSTGEVVGMVTSTPGQKQRTFSMDKQPPSPRPERRSFLSKSPSPNTLSVQLPYHATGQSLPNLTVEPSVASTLSVPSAKALSPSHRGISYPPPSPRSLRRSTAINSPSRNPPLFKTRQVVTAEDASMEQRRHGSASAPYPASIDFDVPIIRGVSPPSDDISPASPSPEYHDSDLSRGTNKRLARSERQDNRRYHTAGAIDDIKKQDTSHRETGGIQKRFSWNYGQMALHPSSGRGLPHAASGMSLESVRSSSGVSSTGSLHLSVCGDQEMGDQLETLEEIEVNRAGYLEHVSPTVEARVLTGRHPYPCRSPVPLPGCAPPPSSPTPLSEQHHHRQQHQHVSSTYISHDQVQHQPGLEMNRSFISTRNHLGDPRFDAYHPPGQSDVRIDVTEVQEGVSAMRVSPHPENAPCSPKSTDLIRMKDFILSDASMEASDV